LINVTDEPWRLREIIFWPFLAQPAQVKLHNPGCGIPERRTPLTRTPGGRIIISRKFEIA
jgi:hypothetical protein